MPRRTLMGAAAVSAACSACASLTLARWEGGGFQTQTKRADSGRGESDLVQPEPHRFYAGRTPGVLSVSLPVKCREEGGAADVSRPKSAFLGDECPSLAWRLKSGYENRLKFFATPERVRRAKLAPSKRGADRCPPVSSIGFLRAASFASDV